MAVTKITKENISGVSATKLSGALPAIDGQYITNVPAGEIMVKSAANPTSTANHSAGTMWVNTTNGEIFVCTDASTDENIWTNVGPGETEVETSYTPAGEQGETYAYIAGNSAQTIEKFPFANASLIANVGTLQMTRTGPYGCYSYTHGFIGAGAGNNHNRDIETFAFASDGACTNWSDMNSHGCYGYNATCSDKEGGYGYLNGGRHSPGYSGGPTYTSNRVSRFPFASQTSSTEIGTLQMYMDSPGNTVDKPGSYAWYHGGYDPGAYTTPSYNYRYAFASSVNSNQISTMLSGLWHYYGEGHQNEINGFLAGGYQPVGANYNATEIQQHSFSSGADSVLWGHLALGNYAGACSSASDDKAWKSRDRGSGVNAVEWFSMSTNSNGTDVADMVTPRGYVAGLHV